MNRAPAFQFYPSDFLSDAKTMVMTAEEIGAYILLISICWREGELSNDLDELAALARMTPDAFKASWEKRICRCFRQTDSGAWVHPRLERERKTQEDFKEERKRSGRRGAERRWSKVENAENSADNGSPMAEPLQSHSSPTQEPMAKHASSSSSSSSSSSNNTEEANASSSSADADIAGVEPPANAREFSEWKQEVIKAWNTTMSLPPFAKVSRITSERDKHLRARFGERDFRERYPDIFSIVNESPFCRGSGPHGWIATFDWVIKNDGNYMKVLEGKYERSRQQQTRRNGSSGGRTYAPNAAEYVELGRELGL
jgi:uncharacterized protein YdaU (DUF1376 family)